MPTARTTRWTGFANAELREFYIALESADGLSDDALQGALLRETRAEMKARQMAVPEPPLSGPQL